jgi:hypothetical protein
LSLKNLKEKRDIKNGNFNKNSSKKRLKQELQLKKLKEKKEFKNYIKKWKDKN